MPSKSIRVSIRADRPAGVVRAFFADEQGPEGPHAFEVGTLNIHLADKSKAAFDAWVAFWEAAMADVLAQMGADVLGFERFGPQDRN